MLFNVQADKAVTLVAAKDAAAAEEIARQDLDRLFWYADAYTTFDVIEAEDQTTPGVLPRSITVAGRPYDTDVPGGQVLSETDTQRRLDEIAALLSPCPPPDAAANGACPCGAPAWPCPTTEAAWLAAGLEPRAEADRLTGDR